MCELLWSDPQALPGRSPSKRGVGVAFGPDVTKRFLDANGLQLLVRSHEARPRRLNPGQGLCAPIPVSFDASRASRSSDLSRGTVMQAVWCFAYQCIRACKFLTGI